jgi:hypothetical protein
MNCDPSFYMAFYDRKKSRRGTGNCEQSGFVDNSCRLKKSRGAEQRFQLPETVHEEVRNVESHTKRNRLCTASTSSSSRTHSSATTSLLIWMTPPSLALSDNSCLHPNGRSPRMPLGCASQTPSSALLTDRFPQAQIGSCRLV